MPDGRCVSPFRTDNLSGTAQNCIKSRSCRKKIPNVLRIEASLGGWLGSHSCGCGTLGLGESLTFLLRGVEDEVVESFGGGLSLSTFRTRIAEARNLAKWSIAASPHKRTGHMPWKTRLSFPEQSATSLDGGVFSGKALSRNHMVSLANGRPFLKTLSNTMRAPW